MQGAQTAEGEGQVLAITFLVSGSLFGMEASFVQEVVHLTTITKVHHAASCVIGVMNLRGHISTVIDLSARLGLGAADLTGGERIIIVEWMGERIGLVVDEMQDVLALDRESIRPAPENVRSAQSQRMTGVFGAGTRIVAMLDLEKVLTLDTDGESGAVVS
ncbi:MAG: chemotaxis protein CheW [Polyangia bacterium]|jgi:purine-binding chemotaxis protein CheW